MMSQMHSLSTMSIKIVNELVRERVSCNLEPEFIQVVGHNVYTTPYQNILAVENALATKSNPNPDDERLKVFLQMALL